MTILATQCVWVSGLGCYVWLCNSGCVWLCRLECDVWDSFLKWHKSYCSYCPKYQKVQTSIKNERTFIITPFQHCLLYKKRKIKLLWSLFLNVTKSARYKTAISATQVTVCGAKGVHTVGQPSGPSIFKFFFFPRGNSALIEHWLRLPAPSPWKPPLCEPDCFRQLVWGELSDWLASLGILTLRLIHVATCIRISVLVTAV